MKTADLDRAQDMMADVIDEHIVKRCARTSAECERMK